MNPGKRGSTDRGSGQKGSDSRRSPAMHERTSGKRSPASSHSPANKCGSIPPLLQNEMNRAAAASFLGNFAGATAFPPSVWQDLPYLLNLNPLQPSFMPRLPLGLDMFSAPFLHPMPGSAPGLFPPGLPLLRPPGSTAGLLHSPFTSMFPNVNDVPVHLLPKNDQTGSRPRSAKKTSSLASSSSESDIASRTGAPNLSNKHDPKPSHSRKEFWHGPAEMAKVDMRKRSSGSPIVSKSKPDEVVDVLSYSDCNHDSPLELTVKKTNVVAATEAGPPKRSSSAIDEVTNHNDLISRANVELHRVMPCEKYPPVPQEDDIECLSLRKTMSDISLSLADQPIMFSTHSGRTGTFPDGVLEELNDKADEDRRLLFEVSNEAKDMTKASCGSGTDFEVSQISGAAPARQNIALPPRKRLTRNPEELGLGVPNQSSGSDSPSSASNFRLYWKKFAAKTNITGQPSHRAFISGGKPVHDCRTYFQKMASKDVCKSGLLIGKTFIAGKGKGFFHRAVSRSSPRFSRTEGGMGVPPDGSTSPRVTRSQSKLKQKKSGGSPKSSPSEPPAPVRKSLRKKTANSKYEIDDLITMGVKGSTKKETPPKGGTKSLGKNTEKELGRSAKSSELSDNADDEDPKKQGKSYSLRDREEKAKGHGSKGVGKDGVQKSGDASSGLSQSMQPVLGGSCKSSESCLEMPEGKKAADDSFEEKAINSGSKHTEHDRKSMSSGVSTCSADVAFDPEILSLPPKFRRAKGKTLSTSQSVSSIEDDRCVEGMHKDIKVDLCRVSLDNDHSLHSGCGKVQCLVDPAVKHSETLVESSCEELHQESKSSKVHPDVAETAGREELGQTVSLQEQKHSQKIPNLVEVEKKADGDKKLEVEKNLEAEKKLEVEKAPEPKAADKPYRSTGGKKSLLYRSSLSAAVDESETAMVSKCDVTVAPPIIAHQEAVSVSAKTPCRGKPDEPATEIDKPLETDQKCRSQMPSVTKGIEKAVYEESKGDNREDLGDGAKVDSVEASREKSILEFPGLHDTLRPASVGGTLVHGPVSQNDMTKSTTEKNSKMVSAVDDSGASSASKRQATPLTRLAMEHETSNVIHDPSRQDVLASGIAAEVKQKPKVSQPSEVVSSDTKASPADRVIGRSEISLSSPVQLPAILPSSVKSSDDNSAKCSGSLGEVSVRKDEFRGGIAHQGASEGRLTEAQRASKKRSLEDTLSNVRNKKLKKGGNLGLDRADKVTVDETQQQISVQVFDVQDVPAKEEDVGVGGVQLGGKSSTVNPLHFYSNRKSLPTSSSSSELSQTVPPMTTTSVSDAGHCKVSPISSKRAQPWNVSVSKQSSRSGGRAKLDISSDLLSSVGDSEPPVLEKTDFTYMEQFSDISDSDEGENRGPPMLEATSDCGVAKAKPCSGLALDKHILFAKIASSAHEKGGASSGSRSEGLGTGNVAKEIVPSCGPFVNLTSLSLIGNASHLSLHRPISNSSTPPPVSHSPAPSSVSRPLAPPPASHSVLSSASPSVSHSSSPCLEHQPSAPPSAGRQKKSSTKQNKNNMKNTKQQSSVVTEQHPSLSPAPTELYNKESHHYSNSTLSADDLESAGIMVPLPDIAKETVAKKKTLSKNKGASRLATSGAKKTSDLSSLLQHCKSFSVVVQKIDEKGRKRQRQSNPILNPDLSREDLSLEVPADAKRRLGSEDRKELRIGSEDRKELRIGSEDRKEPSSERTMSGPLSSSTKRIPAVGRSAKVVSETTTSRKQKPKARKEVKKVTEAKEKSISKTQKRIEKDEVKAETKDESLNLSIYDFDKDSNDEVDFEAPLSSSRKDLSKKLLSLEDSTKPRRPIRLKLHVPEHSPVPTSTPRGRLLSDEKFGVKALKEIQPSTPHSEKSLDSTEKLVVGPTDTAIGHVKCRLVKVGRHQWMSVGDSNVHESSSHGGASDARSTSSTHDGLDFDESLPETKVSKVRGRVLSKQLQSKSDVVVKTKANKSRAKNQNRSEPKKKQAKRVLRATAPSKNASVSENSIPSFSRVESSGALSPNSAMDQASRCSESESLAISVAGQSSNSNDSKILDFLDLLFGDDLEGLVLDDVSEIKVPDTELIVRCAIERASFRNIYDSELDDYHETLSPASTFFIPSDIEMQLAKMTLSDHPLDFRHDTNSALLSPSKQMTTSLQAEIRVTLPLSPAPRNLANDDFSVQHNKENHLEVDRLLTQTLPSSEDADELKNQFGDELMEEFVSWMSPKWDDTSLHDLDDPLNSLNLFSPFMDSPKTRQKMYI